MRNLAWALLLSAVVVVGGSIGVWFLMPLVPGADIKASCHEPLDQSCMDRMRALADGLTASGQLEDAASWYGWAASGGDKIAMFRLGGINYARAVDDAARKTHSDYAGDEAWRRAAVAEMAGFPAETSCGWFRRAADLGYPPAMNNLAECYLHGIGFTRSGLAAVQWHRKAAQAGNPVAAMNLIQDLKDGLGGKADTAAAETLPIKRFDEMSAIDLDDPTLVYTLRAGAQISPEERDMMRADGATMLSVQAAVQASASEAGADCGFLAECSAMQPPADGNATPEAGASPQVTQ